MKQYTTPEQTAKLIELGFEHPKSVSNLAIDINLNFMPTFNYSIGELIEMLPDDGVTDRRFEFDEYNWVIDWDSFDKIRQTSGVDLVDALYDMVVLLKEEGVI